MRKLLFIIYHLSFIILASFPACKEIGPNINLHGNQNSVSDTTYIESPVATPESKVVVIEEFTGIRCVNCPQGHVVIANIKAANPGRVISVSMHPDNQFSNPQFPFSQQNLITADATNLLSYFTWPGFEPIGTIDRKLFSGETALLIDRSEWAAKVSSEIPLTTPVNLTLDRTYDSTTRELTIVAELHYTQNVTEENKLSVLLTEGNITTAQLDGSVIDTFYVHQNVLRGFVSALEGDVITQAKEPGRVVRKVYKKVLDAAWKPANIKVLAFVHEYQNSKQVYQGKELSIQ